MVIFMKLMFASDLHGHAPSCEKTIAAYRREKAERLILLGDLLYHGPRNGLFDGYDPQETARLLNSVKDELLCVRGNCDSEVDQMMLDFPILSDSALILADGHTFFLSHGHHFCPEALPPLKCGDVLLNGHTHLYGAEKVGEIHYLNDGSVSLPKGGNPPTYLIYAKGAFFLKTVGGEEIFRYALD